MFLHKKWPSLHGLSSLSFCRWGPVTPSMECPFHNASSLTIETYPPPQLGLWYFSGLKGEITLIYRCTVCQHGIPKHTFFPVRRKEGNIIPVRSPVCTGPTKALLITKLHLSYIIVVNNLVNTKSLGFPYNCFMIFAMENGPSTVKEKLLQIFLKTLNFQKTI